jgi:hypothetical protein
VYQNTADPAIPADDIVILKLGDPLVQFTPPENDSYTVFDQKLYDEADHIHKIADTRYDEDNGENPAGIAYLVDFTVSDGGQGNDGHVKGIIKRPSLDEHVPACTDQDKPDGQDDAEGEMDFTFHARLFSVRQADRNITAIKAFPAPYGKPS